MKVKGPAINTRRYLQAALIQARYQQPGKGLGVSAKTQHLQSLLASLMFQKFKMGVISVQNGVPTGLYSKKERGFFMGHRLNRFHMGHMHRLNGCNQRHMRAQQMG